MKKYYIGPVVILIEANVNHAMVCRVNRIVKNWETDGSAVASGVLLSSVHIAIDKVTFYCSGYYYGQMGEIAVMDIY